MKACKSLACVLGFVLAFAVVATAATAPSLTFKFTAVNVPGATSTFPYGLSDSGVIVGQYFDKNGLGHGFILDGKKVTTIDDGTNTACYGIDPRGVAIVGEYGLSGATGFLYKDGKFIDIPGPAGAILSGANGINDAGEIVGYYFDSNGISHGFLLKGKTYTTLDVPGAFATWGSGINNDGSIVLSWVDSNGISKASLSDGKKYRTIDVPGAAGSVAEDISTAGDVGYSWWDSAKLLHGALFHGGRYYKFDHPKGIQTYAAGVNDYHVIVGGYQAKSNGPYQGYKATY